MTDLDRLSSLITDESTELLDTWRSRVRVLASAKALDTPTLNDHIPVLLAELAAALHARRAQGAVALAEGSPPAHGLQRLEAGFDIEEVVAEYGILRACINERADALGIAMSGEPARILNRMLDDAIGLAVKSFAEYQAIEVQRRRNEHLAFVAHDLRTPLGAIRLATRILEVRLAGFADPDTTKMMRTLHRNTEQLDTLVSGVLRENAQLLTEMGVAVERRTFDLWPLVEGVSTDLAPLAARGGTVLVNEVPDDLLVHADASLVRRIFQNLLSNAIRYTPGGTVRMGAAPASGAVPVECWVSDDGRGIPPSLGERVFDALETDPEGDGTGLGLAIVKSFVEAHGGRVTMSSAETAGTTFRFTLPDSVAEKPQEQPVAA